MFEIRLETCNKAALEAQGLEMVTQIEEALVNNREQAYAILAYMRSAQKLLEAVDKAVAKQFEADWKANSPIGVNTIIGEQVFCMTDTPSYAYAQHDTLGLYKAKIAQITANTDETKTLKEELKAIKVRIEKDENMKPQHNYTLSYKGTDADQNRKVKIS